MIDEIAEKENEIQNKKKTETNEKATASSEFQEFLEPHQFVDVVGR